MAGTRRPVGPAGSPSKRSDQPSLGRPLDGPAELERDIRRKDRALRHLEALLIVADAKATFVLSGNGDVIEPDDGLCAIGSGGVYALAAARALLKHAKLPIKELALEAMRIASEICIYSNANFTVEEI